jgi:diacylglycerol kinase
MDIKRFFKSFHYAAQGIHYGLKHDQNLRFHFLAAFIVILAGIMFHVNTFELGILGVMIILVITAEMVNTAIEKMVDLIIKEHHEDAKVAKDVSSGMVLIAAVGAIVVGVVIFTPYILRFLGL